MSSALTIVWLSAVWVALWGRPSLANVLGGLAASTVVVLAFPLRGRREGRIRPLAALRLAVHFAGALVTSTARVTWEVVRPRLRVREGLVLVPLATSSPTIATVVANAITLTPGTLTVDVRPSTPAGAESEGEVEGIVLAVHVLRLVDAEAVRAEGRRLEQLAEASFGARRAESQHRQETS